MVEHLVCNQAVVGSSPVASTTLELLFPRGHALHERSRRATLPN